MALALLAGCRAVVDSGITYEECDLTDYVEAFVRDSTLKQIQERCWQTSDTSGDPADLLLEDGDLVIRATEPPDGGLANWDADSQGPMAYQQFSGNFVMATRVEVLDKVNGDQCLQPGHHAGLALRLAGGAGQWVTFMIGPFQPSETLPCKDGDEQLPTMGIVESHAVDGLSKQDKGADEAGIGFADMTGRAVEADIAMCRVNDLLTFYYSSVNEGPPLWRQIGGDFVYDGIEGPVDVGLSVAGFASEEDPGESFRTAAHFQWALMTDTLLTDGCEETLLSFQFPTVE